MKVYILDKGNKNNEKMLDWLYEDKRIDTINTFEDYITFIDTVEKYPPDLCIVRLGMDEIPGLKAAEMVKQISPETRTVFVSNIRDYAVDAYEVGAYGYLLSPVSRDKFNRFFLRGI